MIDTNWIDNGPGWVGVLVRSPETLRSLSPTMPDHTKYAVAALTEATDAAGLEAPALEVRAFFSAGGTREDPVTGSANGSLAQWLLGAGRIAAPYIAAQGLSMGRNGRVYISQTSDGEVWVGGDAITGIDGEVRL